MKILICYKQDNVCIMNVQQITLKLQIRDVKNVILNVHHVKKRLQIVNRVIVHIN